MDLPFLMPIEDIFSISGRGTVVTGRIERGKGEGGRKRGDCGIPRDRTTVCTGVEMFKKQLDEGMAGDKRQAFCCAARRRKMWSAVMVAGQARIDHARTPHSKARCTC